MFNFDIQRFGGGGGTTTTKIPAEYADTSKIPNYDASIAQVASGNQAASNTALGLLQRGLKGAGYSANTAGGIVNGIASAKSNGAATSSTYADYSKNKVMESLLATLNNPDNGVLDSSTGALVPDKWKKWMSTELATYAPLGKDYDYATLVNDAWDAYQSGARGTNAAHGTGGDWYSAISNVGVNGINQANGS